MINLLVADDNMHYSKNLINYLMSKNNEIRLINVSTDGQEVINNICTQTIDILMLDLKMPRLSGIQVLEKIKELKLEKNPIIIVVSGEVEYMKQIINNNLVRSFIDKAAGFEVINTRVQEIIKEIIRDADEKNIKNRILQELLYLGFNIKHIGTEYLAEGIYLVYEYNIKKYNQERYADNLEKYCYKEIARTHSRTTQNIKSNIVKATNYMYTGCKQDKLLKYFTFSYDIKPTPKIIINTVLSKIIQ